MASRSLASRYPTLTGPGRGDAAVQALAVRRHAWVVTADRALRERLRSEGVTVLSPRDRARLERFAPERPAPTPKERRRRHR